MTPFEEQLKRAMQRREPSRDFTARLLARAAELKRERETAKDVPWFKRLSLLRSFRGRLIPIWAALLIMLGGVIYRQHEQTVHGKEAKQKLLVAIHIAGSKLRQAQQQVFELEGDMENKQQ